MYELNELSVNGRAADSGFIIERSLFNGDKSAVQKDRLLIFNDSSFPVKDAMIYIMNGLYALKEEFSVIYVLIFNTLFTVSVKKYADPNEEDFLAVFYMLKQSLSMFCPADVVNTMFNEILAEIKSGKFLYTK